MKKITHKTLTQAYAFGYEPGREREVVGHVMRLADDPNSEITWLDAALVGFHVAREAALACRQNALGTSAQPQTNDE